MTIRVKAVIRKARTFESEKGDIQTLWYATQCDNFYRDLILATNKRARLTDKQGKSLKTRMKRAISQIKRIPQSGNINYKHENKVLTQKKVRIISRWLNSLPKKTPR